jgi:hypothetical protein
MIVQSWSMLCLMRLTDDSPMKPNPLPPIKYLQEMFELDSTSPSGLRWRKAPSSWTKVNTIAGVQRTKDHYWRVRWRYQKRNVDYMAHRIVYALQTGLDPGEMFIDHVNNDKDNNKPLRLASKLQNSHNRNGRRNTSSVYKGVCLIKTTSRWRASIRINKEFKHIGVYNTQEEAALAYNQIASLHFGEFARLNQINFTSN